MRFVPVPMPGSIGGCWRPVGPGGPGGGGGRPCCCWSAVDGEAGTARVALDWVGKRESTEKSKDKQHNFWSISNINPHTASSGRRPQEDRDVEGGLLWFSWIPNFDGSSPLPSLFIHSVNDASTAITQSKVNDRTSKRVTSPPVERSACLLACYTLRTPSPASSSSPAGPTLAVRVEAKLDRHLSGSKDDPAGNEDGDGGEKVWENICEHTKK